MFIHDVQIFRWSDGSRHTMHILSDTEDGWSVAEQVFHVSHFDWLGNFTVSTGDIVAISGGIDRDNEYLLCVGKNQWMPLRKKELVQWFYSSSEDRVMDAMLHNLSYGDF